MALVVKDRVKETTTATGTGSISLGGAVTKFKTFSSALSNGDTTYYAIEQQGNTNEFEVGIGTYASSTNTLARTTILSSSSSNNAVDFSAGTKNVFITYPADKAVYEDASGNISIPGTIDGRDLATDGTKLDGIAASANNYSHPNHSGDVTSSGDGATTIANDAVTSAKIASGAVIADGLGANSVETTKINNGAVTTAKLANDAVDGTKIADNAIDSEHYTDGSIDTAHIGNDQVTYAKIQNVSSNNVLLGNDDGAGSAVQELTAANVRTIINVEDGATADQTAAEIRALVESASDSNVFTDADHSKLNAIEASADVTDTANVTAAGALMDSEVTNLAQVKAFDSSDYATAAQGSTADAAMPKSGGTFTGDVTFDGATSGYDIVFDRSDNALLFKDNSRLKLGDLGDLQLYHDGSNSYLFDAGAGDLRIAGNSVNIMNGGLGNMAKFINGGAVELYHNTSKKLETTSSGIDVTGNIVVSGTVDGRDIAADGSKLDGIQAGATAGGLSADEAEVLAIALG